MSDRFVTFLLVSRWTSAIVALLYHARFLVFVDYGDVHDKTGLAKAFYFITGLGHEAFAVFFVADGILAGLALRPHRSGALADGVVRGAVLRYGGSRTASSCRRSRWVPPATSRAAAGSTTRGCTRRFPPSAR